MFISLFTSLRVFGGIFPPSTHFFGASSTSYLSSSLMVILFSSTGSNTFSTILPIRILFLQFAMVYKKGSSKEAKFSFEIPSLSTLFSSWRKTSLIYNGIPLLVIISSISKLCSVALNQIISWKKENNNSKEFILDNLYREDMELITWAYLIIIATLFDR